MYMGGGDCGCGPCNQGLGQSPASFIGPGVSLITSLVKLFNPPPHMSKFGFHVDDYSNNILANENKIAQLKTQISAVLHQPPPTFPMTPWPPNPANMPPDPQFHSAGCVYAGIPCSQWASAMRPVVAQYSGQSDCVTNTNQNQPGGCYEQTYGAQMVLIQQLQQQLSAAQIQATAAPPPVTSAAYPQAVLVAPTPVPIAPAVVQSPISYAQPSAPQPFQYFAPSSAPTAPPSSGSILDDPTVLLMIGGFALVLVLVANKEK